MREYVEVIRLLLSGEDATYSGKLFQFQHFPRLTPEPLSVPIYFGSSGPRMIRLAGEVGDGVILNSLPTREHIDSAREGLRQGGEQSRREAGSATLASSIIYSVSDDLEEAAAAAREDVLFYLGYPEVNPILEESGLMETANAIRGANRDQGKEAGLELITPGLLDRLAVYGDAQRCRARLRELIDSGIDLPIIRVSNVPYPERDKKRVFLRAIESLKDF